MKNPKDNVCFVLVEPKEPGNAGASARAIKNMGFKNLCMVKPAFGIGKEALRFARNAEDVLVSAERRGTLDDALKDKSLVVGATRRAGRSRGVFLSPVEGAMEIMKAAAKNKVAVLFGREAKGLTNEEVQRCGFMITIPTGKRQPSLNLSHAVLLVAYELHRESISSRSSKPSRSGANLVTQKEMSELYKRLSDVLKLLEYAPRGGRDIEGKIMSNVRHLLGRAGLTRWELGMLRGVCAQAEKRLKKQ